MFELGKNRIREDTQKTVRFAVLTCIDKKTSSNFFAQWVFKVFKSETSS